MLKQIKLVNLGQLRIKNITNGFINTNAGRVEVFVAGDVLGSLDNKGNIRNTAQLAVQQLIKEISDLQDLHRLSLVSYVGSFTVIINHHESDNVFLTVSTTGVTPYVELTKENVRISFDENQLLNEQKSVINDSKLKSISQSHQLVVRYPTSLFGIDNILGVQMVIRHLLGQVKIM